MMRNWHFNHIDFSTYPHYAGNDLGVTWSNESTRFRIWAPTARIVELRLYNAGRGGRPTRVLTMEAGGQGVWSLEEKGNLEGMFYTFRVNDGEWLHETAGPYARATGINGTRGMIFNPLLTNPDGWDHDKGPRLKNFTDWIIYETHIRDFTISHSSGVILRGKYAGFIEENTCSSEGAKTGLSHLSELGITHVHLLPVNDFMTVDEEFPELKYNWGYDPQHFNVPEGSYSSDPFDGRVRIMELKQMIKSLHDHGIGVILDVVYNHTYLTKGSVFNQVVPGYYYRQNPDGSFSNASGCGNELAPERSMVRQYITNSLLYWAREYHVDGFRFDLMGIFDNESMRHIRKELDRFDKGIFIYGEGWAGGPSPMNESMRAVKQNIAKLPGIAAFCDDMRDALKGNHHHKTNPGFVGGQGLREEAVKFGIVAATWHPQIVYGYVESSHGPWAEEPSQCINYVACHDNYTLFDKLKLSSPDATEADLRRMVKLAGAILLTSQGIPFLLSGMEFCRSKGGNGNSYKAPDAVNQIEWLDKTRYTDVFEYYRKLIELRKNHPSFRMPHASMIRENLNFCSEYKIGVVSYCLDGKAAGDSWGQVFVAFNGNRETVNIPKPPKSMRLIALEDEINEEGISMVNTPVIEVPPVSMVILAC